MSRSKIFAACFLASLSACFLPPAQQSSSSANSEAELLMQTWTTVEPDLAISHAPFRQIEVNWKQRLDQPYVFVDYVGSYIQTGKLLPMVQQAMLDQGLQPSGPPFALFYDDPGLVASEKLRSRACVPVNGRVNPSGELAFAILPSTTVVYAFAGGPYPDVPQSYPGLFAFMRKMGWVENGPIRETYFVPPGAVESFDQLVTEVQLPVTFAQ